MNFKKEVCLLVDAYSTTNKLAGIINAYGYPCIHVQSSSYIPDILKRSFRLFDFWDVFVCKGAAEDLCHKISSKGYEIKCVITGSESGVLLGDYLAQHFNVPGNKVTSSLARRNKYLMTETLKSHGINHIRQTKVNKLEELYEWVNTHQLNPVVLKPLLSSGTNGFHICHNNADLEKAFTTLHLSKDIFGNINKEILVQEYIEGQEYSVNMMNYEGHSYLCEIWKTDKHLSKHSKVYDLETITSEEDEHFFTLVSYAKEVLKVLEIDYGPSHLEIYIKPDGTPVLVEAAARFMASIDIALVTKAYGTNALLLAAEAYLESENFLKRATSPRPKLRQHPAMVQLISSKEGILVDYHFDTLKKLKTFYGVDAYVKPGQPVQQSIDSGSLLGQIYLVGENKEEIKEDYLLIRSLEKSGELYTIQPTVEEKIAVC